MPSGADLDGTERAAILAPALDYIESWLDVDPDRMARCLHPDLVKREVEYDGLGRTPRLDTMTRVGLHGLFARRPLR
jgi:hypothetical protein